MWLWICMSSVVKKLRVKTNGFGFKVNSERGRVSYGSVICDYTAWLGSSACDMCCLRSGQTGVGSEAGCFRVRARYTARCCAFSDTILDNLSANKYSYETSPESKSKQLESYQTRTLDLQPCFFQTDRDKNLHVCVKMQNKKKKEKAVVSSLTVKLS